MNPAALLFSLVLLLALATSAPASRPNIIYILADDLGYGDLSCYGQATLRTPNLDRLAAEGIRFTRHYAGNTVCSPSRAVLMTGLHSGHLPIRGNADGPLPDELPTLPGLLRRHGYHTACIGKWGVGNGIPLDDPRKKGFDHFLGYVSMYHAHNFFPEYLVRNGRKEPLPNELHEEWRTKGRDGAGIAKVQKVFAPHHLQEEVLKYLSEMARQAGHQREAGVTAENPLPFFLYYALNIPHANNEGGRMPPRGMEVPLGKDGRPDYGTFSNNEWPDPEKGFAQYITFIDRYVGEILKRLEELGLSGNTLVLFSSDNGPHSEGGHQHGFFDSNGPWSGFKRSMTEGGIRVPFIARWPGTIAPGGVSEHLSSFQDILPTCAELAGIEEQPPTDGISFVPTLRGEDGQKDHEFLYWEFHRNGGRGSVALLQDHWKMIAPLTEGEIGEPVRLYKLNKDPAEEGDLSRVFSHKAADLLALARGARAGGQ